jgi:integrase/recombinase XerD
MNAVPIRHSWKPAGWPDAHRRAWEAALKPGDLIEEAGGAAGWRARSIVKTAAGYGQWLAWNAKRGEDLNGSPEALVTRERVLAWLEGIAASASSYTVACRAQELFDAVRVMVPDLDWSWLKMTSIQARRRARPSRNKIERLRSASDIEDLGMSLMRSAHDVSFRGTRRQRALQMRDGLIISLLITRLLRLKNITQIGLGKHLIQRGGRASLAFSADEMKGRRAAQVTVPDWLMPWLTLYLDQHRLELLGNEPVDHGRLWVSGTGSPLAEVSLHNAVRRRTKTAFGKPIPPHWFRDAAITTLVIHNPRYARDSRELLDHVSSETAEKHYNQAQALVGVRKYHEVLGGLMRGRVGPR